MIDPTTGTSLREREPTLSEELVRGLLRLGIKNAFGIAGGGIAHLYDALCRSEINVFHCRHETGAAYSAIEAFFASGVPSLVYTTTGPGAVNAVPGLAAAKGEDAKVLIVTAVSNAVDAGRWSIQETSTNEPSISLYAANNLFDLSFDISCVAQLQIALRSLQTAFASPLGCVARIAIPVNMQGKPCGSVPEIPSTLIEDSFASGIDLERTLRILREETVGMIVGYGCRDASAELTEFVDTTNIPVALTPRAKGILDENHPNCLGVMGLGGYGNVEQFFVEHPVDRIMVIGTRLGEASTFWSPAIHPRHGFIHVDVNPGRIGSAFPEQPVIGLCAEAKHVLRELTTRLKQIGWTGPEGRYRTTPLPAMRPEGIPASSSSRVHPAELMSVLQREVLENRDDALIMAESGNAFVWTTHHLRFRSSGQYRISTLYGAMGHFSSGAFGAACVHDGLVISIVGDGAFLMMNELHTAVQYDVNVIWIILNDASYSTCHFGLSSQKLSADHMIFPQVDFVAVARGVGAKAQVIRDNSSLQSALQWALSQEGPVVLDVLVNSAQSPFAGRINSLFKNGEVEVMESAGP